LNLTPQVSSLPASVSSLSLQTPTSGSGSQTNLLLQRSQTEKVGGGSFAVLKQGWAKVKEEGGLLRGLVWNDRFLLLREYTLDFMKSNESGKVNNTIYLKDVINITRSEVHPYSFEITRTLNPNNGQSPPRDGPTKLTICKVTTDDDVYSWIDSIYTRCPSMGGVSNPTNFTHRVHVGFDPVSGAFVGLPPEWERLLASSAISKDDYQRNPEAVVEVLNFYTEKLMKRAEDPQQYPSLTPTPPVEAQANKQLGYGGMGNSIAPPRPTPPNAFQRQDSFGQPRANNYSPVNEKSRQQEEDQRIEEERRRRMEDDRRRRQEQERREAERRDREEQAAYNASLPKSRPPIAQTEIGGGGYGAEDRKQSTSQQPDRYNPSRPPPSTPTSASRDPRQQAPSMRQPLQASRPAPPKPNGTTSYSSTSQSKPQGATNGARQQSPSGKYAAGSNGAPLSRAPPSGSSQTRIPAATAPKPLNVPAKNQEVKKAEAALTRKDDGGGRKEVRMSSMSEAEVMTKLREVVSKERPLDSYNKQKKIGQGASGSVYVARIRENATSPMARKILRDQGPKAQVAIKQMDLRNQPRKELIVNEIIVMKESRHENIVNFLDAFLQEESFELWVVMEFMEGGALTDIIDNNTTITEDQIATVCLEVSLMTPVNSRILTAFRLARVYRICTPKTSSIVTSRATTFF
jgi:protein-serine/threonine kinase